VTLAIAVFVYATAMTLANLSVAAFGPWVSPINAFVLIGLDLALRPLERPVRRVVEKRKERR